MRFPVAAGGPAAQFRVWAVVVLEAHHRLDSERRAGEIGSEGEDSAWSSSR